MGVDPEVVRGSGLSLREELHWQRGPANGGDRTAGSWLQLRPASSGKVWFSPYPLELTAGESWQAVRRIRRAGGTATRRQEQMGSVITASS